MHASPRNQHCANCIGTLSFPIAQWHAAVMYMHAVGHDHITRLRCLPHP